MCKSQIVKYNPLNKLLKPPDSREKSKEDMTSVFPVVAVVFGSDLLDTSVS